MADADVWSDVNVWLTALAGFAAGHVMALGAFWLEAAFGYQTSSPRLSILSLGLHLVYGALLGLIYIP